MHATLPRGNVELLHELAELGADVHRKGSNGANLLWQAAYFGHGSVVDYAVAQGVDLEEEAGHPDDLSLRFSPLHVGAFMGNTGAVRALLVALANPNVCNARSRSPLEDAVECSHAEIVQLLIAADADIFKPCTDMTPTVKKEMMRDSILKQLSLT